MLRVGDTLTEGETIKIVGIPNFAPEILRRVRLEDPMKSKQLKRALDDLAEEGVTQVFRRVIGGDHIVGVVGELQLDVLKTRVEAEYQVKIDLEPAPFETARWISADSKADLEAFMSANRGGMSEDRDGSPVFLARNAWELGYIAEKSPKIKFSDIRERSYVLPDRGPPRRPGVARSTSRDGHRPWPRPRTGRKLRQSVGVRIVPCRKTTEFKGDDRHAKGRYFSSRSSRPRSAWPRF